MDDTFDEERKKKIDKRKELKRELLSGGLKGNKDNFDPLNPDPNFLLEDKLGIAEFNATLDFELKKIEESNLSNDDKLVAISELEKKAAEFRSKLEKRFHFDARNPDQFADEREAIAGLESSLSKISKLKFALRVKSDIA
jgi:hypothetical protein